MKKYDNYKDSGIEWIGDIPSHWETILFKRVILKIKDGTHGTFQRVSDGYPFLSAKNVYDDGVSIGKNESYISESDYLEITKNGFPQKDDLLITCVGTIGRTFVYSFDESMAFQRSVTFIRFNNGINPQFYKYYVQSSKYQNLLISLAKTSAQSGIYMGDLMNTTTLKIPNLEQTQIANYLDHKTIQIDTLISKKEQFITLLQEERIAVINQAVTKGLDPKVKMKDSGIEWLGEIPEHWEVKRIGHLSKVIRGASPRPAGDPLLFNGDFLPWITVKEVTNAKGKFIISTDTFLTELGSVQTRILEPETLILSNSGATLGVPRITLIKGGINDGSVAFSNLKIERDYLYHFFTTHTDIYREEASGYGQPNLNTEIVKSTKMPAPPNIEQNLIVEFIENQLFKFEKLISKSEQEIELLKEFKTALISEVVTGKVDVRDVVLN